MSIIVGTRCVAVVLHCCVLSEAALIETRWTTYEDRVRPCAIFWTAMKRKGARWTMCVCALCRTRHSHRAHFSSHAKEMCGTMESAEGDKICWVQVLLAVKKIETTYLALRGASCPHRKGASYA